MFWLGQKSLKTLVIVVYEIGNVAPALTVVYIGRKLLVIGFKNFVWLGPVERPAICFKVSPHWFKYFKLLLQNLFWLFFVERHALLDIDLIIHTKIVHNLVVLSNSNIFCFLVNFLGF